jgi:hypothetical protein
MMDGTGISQIEQGIVSLLDERTTLAMRISLESALRDIASRFALKAHVVQAVASDGSARFVVVLAVTKATSVQPMPAQS